MSRHSSGVIHTGIYYEHDIDYRRCGKLIVARSASELSTTKYQQAVSKS